MKQILLNVNESKFKIFLDFIKTLDYVEVDKTDYQFIAELKASFSEVKLMQEGKIPKKDARDFLNNL